MLPFVLLSFVRTSWFHIIYFKSGNLCLFLHHIGMIALAEVIADSKTMLRMDLRENDPYVGGLMALSLALKVNKSLVRIDLDKELKKEPVRPVSVVFGLYLLRNS